MRYVLATLVVFCCTWLSNTSLAQDSPDAWVQHIEMPQYFAVMVEDVDTAVEWYQSVFLLNEVGGSQADDGSWRIENLRNDHLAVEIIYDQRAEGVDRALGFRKVGFQVPDVDAVAERIEQSTGERPRVVDFAQTGMRILQIKDPEDNTIQLFSPLVVSE